MLHENLCRLVVGLVDNSLDFVVDFLCRMLGVVLVRRKVVPQENLFVPTVVDRAEFFAEAVLCHHFTRDRGCLLDIAGRADGDVIQLQFLRDTTAHARNDVIVHRALGVEHLVVLRQIHRVSACTTSRNDGNLVDRHMFRQ